MSRFLAGALAVSIILAGCGAPAPVASFATPADVNPAALVSNSSANLKAEDVTGPYAAIAPGATIPGNDEISDADINSSPAAGDTTPVLPDFTGGYSAVEPGAVVPEPEELAEVEEDAASALALDDFAGYGLQGYGLQSLFLYNVSIFKIRDRMSTKTGRKGNFAKACEKALETAGKKTSQEMKDLLAEGAKGKEPFLVKAYAMSNGGEFTLSYDRKWRLLGLKTAIKTAEEHQAFYDVAVKLAGKYAN